MGRLTGWMFEVVVVSWLNLRTLTQRLTSSLVAVVGIAGVVAVFVAVLSMAEGFRATMATTGSADTAVVMRSGADSEMVSILTRDDTRIIADAPGVLRNAQGPVVSPDRSGTGQTHRGSDRVGILGRHQSCRCRLGRRRSISSQ